MEDSCPCARGHLPTNWESSQDDRSEKWDTTFAAPIRQHGRTPEWQKIPSLVCIIDFMGCHPPTTHPWLVEITFLKNNLSTDRFFFFFFMKMQAGILRASPVSIFLSNSIPIVLFLIQSSANLIPNSSVRALINNICKYSNYNTNKYRTSMFNA